MSDTYHDKSFFDTKPHSIGDETKKAIGTLLLATAEIDDLLSLLLFKLSKIEPPNGFLLIGQLAVSAKISRIEHLFKKYAPEKLDAFQELKVPIERIFGCRNTIAHGVYRGIANNGRLIFVATSKTFDPDNGFSVQKAYGFTEAQIIDAATLAEKFAKEIEDSLGLKPLREKRFRPDLTTPRPRSKLQ